MEGAGLLRYARNQVLAAIMHDRQVEIPPIRMTSSDVFRLATALGTCSIDPARLSRAQSKLQPRARKFRRLY